MPAPRSVLFVDDEPQILSGLRRMLAPHRHEWNCEYVQSGDDALARLADADFDVIVSDMRMPGMSGAELLGTVAEQHPGVARIILSGAASESDLMLSVRSAHQFLSKPCDRHLLETVVGRALMLKDLLRQPELIELVSSISALPSFPAVAAEILEEVQSEDPSLVRLADIVTHDVALSAKLLQLVNSSFFGLPRQVTDPSEAVKLLGATRVTALAVGRGLFRDIPVGAAPYSFDRLWRRSTNVASVAWAIAKAAGTSPELANLAYMGGLLSVAGTLILASHHTDRYLRIASHPSQIAAEDAVVSEFGAGSAQLGAYVLGLWGLPAMVVEAVAFHRAPLRSGALENVIPLAGIHVATVVLEADAQGEEPVFDEAFLEAAGLADRLDDMVALCYPGADR
jgi:HD-like signal output (HDOD) protein/ActR/RegA family two-component response regulator